MGTDEPTGDRVLALPMGPNESGAQTIRGYLVELVKEVWDQEEGFSGKRPFGNSGWQSDLYLPLVRAGMIHGSIDTDGYLDGADEVDGDRLIRSAIEALR